MRRAEPRARSGHPGNTRHGSAPPPRTGVTAAAAVLLAALLVPSVRAAADQLLQIFRAQSVVYISVSPSRLRQLEHLRGDQNALFLSPPTEVGTPPSVQAESSVQAAQALVGFVPQAPTTLPGRLQHTLIEVRGQSTYQVRVNVPTVRQMLTTLGVTDVTVPDALGKQPITVALPPVAHLQYRGPDYSLNLTEGTSPTVNLPAGVDLAQLGKAALEVYGMSPQQADAMSKQINWASTLVFPFPLTTSQVQQVDINGATGILLESNGTGDGGLLGSASQSNQVSAAGTASPASNQWQGVVYWQRGSHFYILTGQGATIFLNSHLLSEVEVTCDRVAFIKAGVVLRTLALRDVAAGGRHYKLRVDAVTPAVLACLAPLVEEWRFLDEEAYGEFGVGADDPRRETAVPTTLEFVTSDACVPEVARAVLGAGAQLYALTPRHTSLEQLFLETIGTEDSGQ